MIFINTNLVFDAGGAMDGIISILSGFNEALDASFSSDVISTLVTILGALIVIVGTWFGLRAIMRAIFKAL